MENMKSIKYGYDGITTDEMAHEISNLMKNPTMYASIKALATKHNIVAGYDDFTATCKNGYIFFSKDNKIWGGFRIEAKSHKEVADIVAMIVNR